MLAAGVSVETLAARDPIGRAAMSLALTSSLFSPPV